MYKVFDRILYWTGFYRDVPAEIPIATIVDGTAIEIEKNDTTTGRFASKTFQHLATSTQAIQQREKLQRTHGITNYKPHHTTTVVNIGTTNGNYTNVHFSKPFSEITPSDIKQKLADEYGVSNAFITGWVDTSNNS